MPDLIRHPPSSSPRGRAGGPRIKSGVTRKEERPRQKWRGLFWFTRRRGGRGGTPIRGSHRGSFGPSITGSSLSEVGVPAGAFSGKSGRKPEAPAALGPSRTSASRSVREVRKPIVKRDGSPIKDVTTAHANDLRRPSEANRPDWAARRPDIAPKGSGRAASPPVRLPGLRGFGRRRCRRR